MAYCEVCKQPMLTEWPHDHAKPTQQPSAAWTLEEMVARDYDPWTDGSQDAQAKLYKAIARAVAQRCVQIVMQGNCKEPCVCKPCCAREDAAAAILAWQKEGK